MMHQNIIQAEELSALIGTSKVVIMDCRFFLADVSAGRKAYLSGHIQGAQYAHLDNDLSGLISPGLTGRHPFPTKTDFVKSLSRWGIDNSTQVIAYDQGHGGIAARLWFMLRWIGHEKAAVLNGGWNHWEKTGMPVSTQPTPVEPKQYIPAFNEQLISSVEELESLLNDQKICLIDSRAAIRYRGEKEPIDPVAGHIPGAVSAPFLENLGEDGLFLPKEVLRKRFEQLLGNRKPQQSIFYCGSGVTACHNLLAMDYAGLFGARLYPGSWSEWIVDAGRPYETKNK